MKTIMGFLAVLLMAGVGCQDSESDGPVSSGWRILTTPTGGNAVCCGVEHEIRNATAIPAARPPGGPIPEENDLHWTFSDELDPFPPGMIDHIRSLWTEVRPMMRRLLGPPSANLTVTVVYDDNLPFPGAYRYWENKLLLRHTPDWMNFDKVFIHETVHAFQDAAFDSTYVSWAVEGMADCVMDLVTSWRHGSRPDGDIHVRNYEEWCERGRDVLSGSRFFMDTLSPINAYLVARLFWLLLTASQGEGPSAEFERYDYMARFCSHLYSRGLTYRQQDVLDAIAATALVPIEASSARAWAEAQPITCVDGRAGFLIEGGVASRFLRAGDGSSSVYAWLGHRATVGGRATYQGSFSLPVRAFNVHGEEVWTGTLTQFQASLPLPDAIRLNPGAYFLEVDGTAYGAGVQAVTAQVVPSSFSSTDSGFLLFDPINRRLLNSPVTMAPGDELLSHVDGSYVVRPGSPDLLPSGFALTAPTPLGAFKFARVMARPRHARLDLPAADLLLDSVSLDDDTTGESLGDGDGAPESGERVELRVMVRNAGTGRAAKVKLHVEWESAPVGLSWYRSEVRSADLEPGETLESEPFLLDVATSERVTGSYRIVWRNAWGDEVVIGTGVVEANRPVLGADIRSISGGGSHTLAAARSDGLPFAWGRNSSGQLGDGTVETRTRPTSLIGFSGIVEVAAGTSHSLARRSDGRLLAWGSNAGGQLGDGTTITRTTPVEIPGIEGVVAIACGGYHSLALTSDGRVWGWGTNTSGQLGDGTLTSRLSPGPVPDLAGVTAISAGSYHSAVVLADGTAMAFGANWFGQLGDGTGFQQSRPVPVPGLSDVRRISAGHYHTLAVKGDGSAWAWGYNGSGQLGDDTFVTRYAPIRVTGSFSAIHVEAGTYHSMALDAEGGVWTWGSNAEGQLGDGSRVYRTIAHRVASLSSIVGISAGSHHSLALDGSGALWAWGDNGYGTLGDGTTTDRLVPVRVQGSGR